MKFSKRILSVCAMVPVSECVAEIGCDHGKVLLCIMMNGKAQKGLACDISEQSLDKARKLYNSFPEYDIDTFCCDGLQRAAMADCAVIAGIGGLNTIDILKDNPGIKSFVLQPSDSVARLREYLVENGFAIIDEDIVFDGRYYCIIRADTCESEQRLSPLQLELGPRNLEKDNCLGYAKWRLSICEKALATPAECIKGKRMQEDLYNTAQLLRGYIQSSERD